ncbi:hypothetical protein HGM15179_014321 [Zosterops borbonicus]|uniref:Uncharacterized protein n=1 Tax=Zosterops borbonicus TaxID=364589 RepID=A0A8K1G6F2_9PASS|nr:hypothetical protein HGM15179_014321 [Zosterops borbonicus]
MCRLEETFKIIESNPALTPQLGHGIKCHIQSFLKHIQGWSRDEQDLSFFKGLVMSKTCPFSKEEEEEEEGEEEDEEEDEEGQEREKKEEKNKKNKNKRNKKKKK